MNSTRGPELKWKRGQRRRKSAPKEEKEARLGRSLARCSRLARCFSREDEEKSLCGSVFTKQMESHFSLLTVRFLYLARRLTD